jgi:hypothetical protein
VTASAAYRLQSASCQAAPPAAILLTHNLQTTAPLCGDHASCMSRHQQAITHLTEVVLPSIPSAARAADSTLWGGQEGRQRRGGPRSGGGGPPPFSNTACMYRLMLPMNMLLLSGSVKPSDDPTGKAHQDRCEDCVNGPVCGLPDGGGRHPAWAVPGDSGTDSPPDTPTCSVQMMGVAANIVRKAWGQRRRSAQTRENTTLQVHNCGFRRCSDGSARALHAWNLLGSTPKRVKIMETADGGRQREVIWAMSVNEWDNLCRDMFLAIS